MNSVSGWKSPVNCFTAVYFCIAVSGEKNLRVGFLAAVPSVATGKIATPTFWKSTIQFLQYIHFVKRFGREERCISAVHFCLTQNRPIKFFLAR